MRPADKQAVPICPILHLPERAGAVKGLSFGVLCWTVMGLLFFPLPGLGVFATSIGLGLWPALFSLVMLLTYSVVMGVVYDALNSYRRLIRSPRRRGRAVVLGSLNEAP